MRALLTVAFGWAAFSSAAVLAANDEPAVKEFAVPAAKERAVPAATIMVIGGSEVAGAVEEEPLANIEERATHEQTQTIAVPRTSQVNAFCLAGDGRILVACGDDDGEVRVLDGKGKQVADWSVPVKPEAINTAPDGTVLVAGRGRLFRYSTTGELLADAESPHAAQVRKSKDKLRQQARDELNNRQFSPANQVSMYERVLAQLEEKQKTEPLNAQEQQILVFLPEQIKRLKELQAARGEQPADKPSEEQLDQKVEAMSNAKLRVASISSDGQHVYVGVPTVVGYTFDVWRMNTDFGQGKMIVSGLRGCCGQMDVQASSSGVYVAENSRHRVACFQPDGELKTAWGERDRTGTKGFTSCCNPMNVCFNAAGDVFTAESSTGRIKQFGADGEFKAFVGDVKLVPGCKNVSIAVSDDDQRVYMLDITRNHIVVMQRKPTSAETPPTRDDEAGQ